MRHIAEDMTNPYGNDATDYPLDFDLLNLWEESKETIQTMRASAGGDLTSRMITAAEKQLRLELQQPVMAGSTAPKEVTREKSKGRFFDLM